MFKIFEDELARIDSLISVTPSSDIPTLFRYIPLDIFGELLLNVPPRYPSIKNYFPSMASDEVQIKWTGKSGRPLLNQTLDFLRTMVYSYAVITGNKINNANILDYGCGWGRLIRPLYKLIPADNIYAVDPWIESIKQCEQHGIMCNLALSDYVPDSLSFERKFDLIYAFSVFTHLSEKTTTKVLQTLRKYINDNGMLAITIRPKEYWLLKQRAAVSSEMLQMHEKNGFAFTPHNHAYVANDGDITYGDTSISLAYIENLPGWKVMSVENSDTDSYQISVFLKPF
jgi:2-polyprenyl-3-methyl-5-hydroxy-6-metoxy-1,4-benzoquinol methylase